MAAYMIAKGACYQARCSAPFFVCIREAIDGKNGSKNGQVGEKVGEKQDKKNANLFILLRLAFLFVVSPGIEPGTQGFSVLCSTN